MAPTGSLKGNRVLLRDEKEASPLYNKGAFGTPLSGGGIDLDIVEALYLVDAGRLSVEDAGRRMDPADLLALGARSEREFEVRYVVYRDLRNRGFLVKAGVPSQDPLVKAYDFHLYPRGGFPGKTPSSTLVRAGTERVAFHAARWAEEAARAAGLGKSLLAAIVDEEGDLTYYDVKLADPRGEVPVRPRDHSGERAHLLADRVVAHGALADALASEEHYGRALSPGRQLSPEETLYLLEETGMGLEDAASGERVAASAFRARARGLNPEFDALYPVFRDLRARALVVKTGFKYGTHFRVYRSGPDEGHAPYLVHVLGEKGVPWPEIAGFIRLAHGVRKAMLFATSGGRYVELTRTRP
ncbi:MAG TPA: tRNA-intron lyase [Candidatus Thermoplasmatota archaeon]|nr:tRNA-intron lyase [Candidatus Thermoplasmatota archaeon]